MFILLSTGVYTSVNTSQVVQDLFEKTVANGEKGVFFPPRIMVQWKMSVSLGLISFRESRSFSTSMGERFVQIYFRVREPHEDQCRQCHIFRSPTRKEHKN